MGGIWWSLNNASIGLLGVWFGNEFLEEANTIMSTFAVWIPYAVFTICTLCLLFVVVTWLLERFVKRFRKRSSMTQDDELNAIGEIMDRWRQRSK